MQTDLRAAVFAFDNEGNKIPINSAMIPTTTSNSINVKPRRIRMHRLASYRTPIHRVSP
jgi:hypothetical protein